MPKTSPAPWILFALVAVSLAVQPAIPLKATPAAAAPVSEERPIAPSGAAPAAATVAPALAEKAAELAPEVLAPIAQPAPAVEPVRLALERAARDLSPEALSLALDAVAAARAAGAAASRPDLLTIIDYSLPSTAPRLWVLDLARGERLYHELVAHGRGTGDNYATRFSNTPDSRQSSLGLFLTGGTYQGGNGYSMKLFGLDPGLNDRAEERHIVMHGAWYVSADHARRQGRLGRSWGCPALSETIAPAVIDTIKGGSFLYAYHPDEPLLARAAGGARTPTTVRAAR